MSTLPRIASPLIALALASGCKSEDPKPPASKSPATYTSTWTGYTGTGSGFNTGLGGANPALGNSQCQQGSQPTFSSSGGTGQILNLTPGMSVNWTFRAADPMGYCMFEVFRIDAMGLPAGLTVSGNDSAQAAVIGMSNGGLGYPNAGTILGGTNVGGTLGGPSPILDGITNTGAFPAGGSSANSGSIMVTARNLTACARTTSEAECRTYAPGASSGSSFDVQSTFQWTMGGGLGGTLLPNGLNGGLVINPGATSGLSGSAFTNANNASDMMLLSLGMSLISSLFGGPGMGMPMNGFALTGGGMNGLANPMGFQSNLGYPGMNGFNNGFYNDFDNGMNNAGMPGNCSGLQEYQCQQSGCQWNGWNCIGTNLP